jgi:ribulose-phosphate 3-epimerase
LTAIEAILPDVDLVLLMSVNPGFGGQDYIPHSTARIRRLRQMLDAIGSPALLEVDGGVKPSNAGEVVAAGATALVAGSALFKGDVASNVAALKAAAARGTARPARRTQP